VTRPVISIHSPGCLRSPTGTECSRACLLLGVAGLGNRTPGPIALRLAWCSQEPTALERRQVRGESITDAHVVHNVGHV
jgi:hypothetical protein